MIFLTCFLWILLCFSVARNIYLTKKLNQLYINLTDLLKKLKEEKNG